MSTPCRAPRPGRADLTLRRRYRVSSAAHDDHGRVVCSPAPLSSRGRRAERRARRGIGTRGGVGSRQRIWTCFPRPCPLASNVSKRSRHGVAVLEVHGDDRATIRPRRRRTRHDEQSSNPETARARRTCRLVILSSSESVHGAGRASPTAARDPERGAGATAVGAGIRSGTRTPVPASNRERTSLRQRRIEPLTISCAVHSRHARGVAGDRSGSGVQHVAVRIAYEHAVRGSVRDAVLIWIRARCARRVRSRTARSTMYSRRPRTSWLHLKRGTAGRRARDRNPERESPCETFHDHFARSAHASEGRPR